nr:photosystem II protein T [Flexiglena variabilis]WCH63485.1 photosystem II protein T [Flexiglena variabilis]
MEALVYTFFLIKFTYAYFAIFFREPPRIVKVWKKYLWSDND